MFTPNRIIFRSVAEAPSESGIDFNLRIGGVLGEVKLSLRIPSLAGAIEGIKGVAENGMERVRGLVSRNLTQPEESREARESEGEKGKVSPQLESIQKIKNQLERIKNSPGAKRIKNPAEIGYIDKEGEDAACLGILKQLNALKRFLGALNEREAEELRNYLELEMVFISEKLDRLKSEITPLEQEVERMRQGALKEGLEALLSRKRQVLDEYNLLVAPTPVSSTDLIVENIVVDDASQATAPIA